MKRQEFIDAVVISASGSSYVTEVGIDANLLFDNAERLADERAKRYPFEYDVIDESHIPISQGRDTFDPYEVDWNEAPEWANYHAVDEDGEGFWYQKDPKIEIRLNMWILCDIDNKSMESEYYLKHNPNWKESLRKRP